MTNIMLFYVLISKIYSSSVLMSILYFRYFWASWKIKTAFLNPSRPTHMIDHLEAINRSTCFWRHKVPSPLAPGQGEERKREGGEKEMTLQKSEEGGDGFRKNRESVSSGD